MKTFKQFFNLLKEGGNLFPDTRRINKQEVIPTNIRLDFGINKDQGNVIVENLKFDYFGRHFEFKGSDFFNYFDTNNAIKTEIDHAKGIVKFIKNNEKFITPFYYPNQAFLNKIKKITKG